MGSTTEDIIDELKAMISYILCNGFIRYKYVENHGTMRKYIWKKNKEARIMIRRSLQRLELYSVMFLLIAVMAGCGIEQDKSANNADYSFEEESIPVLWIDATNQNYQPTYGYRTVIEKDIATSATYMNQDGFQLGFTNEDRGTYLTLENVQFRVEDGEGNALTDNVDVDFKEDGRFSIVPLNVTEVHWEIGRYYNLHLEWIQSEEVIYYDLPVFYNDTNPNATLVNQAKEQQKVQMADNEMQYMGEPLVQITKANEASAMVSMIFTGAARVEEAFEYRDYDVVYTYDVTNQTLALQSSDYKDKQRYRYNQEMKQWDLGYETMDNRHIQVSEQRLYEVIYDEQEIVLYNRADEQLLGVYRLDALDSDYVYDEYRNYKVHVIDVLDNGDVLFAVAGYIQDKSRWTGKNGIMFYRYEWEKGLNQLAFLESAKNPDAMIKWLDTDGYYSSVTNRFYLENKQMLYSFDLDYGEAQYIDTFFDGRFNMQTGTVFWQGNDSKVNGGIYTMDLNEYPLEVHNLYKAGITQRVVGVDNEYIIVGQYSLDHTYEALDQTMTYGYSTIYIYNYAGQLISTYNSVEAGERALFGEAYVDDVSGEWKVDYIRIQEVYNENPKNAEVRYLPLNKEKILIKAADMDGTIEVATPIDSAIIDTVHATPKSLFMTKASMKRQVIHPTVFETFPLRNAYVYEDAQGNQTFAGTYRKALSLGEDSNQYKVYRMDYDANQLDTHRLTLLFDASQRGDTAYIGNVMTMPQRPELPRGCEVTALSILLNYYMDQAPGKMTLASELKVLDDVYQVVDGMIEFGNMHVGFAGSMSDTSKPGLGAYIEPIQELAENYMPGQIIPLSGLDFDQILTYVSMDHPVLIIIPNRYQEVPDYSKEVWRTDAGYMEVTYQEHSVVIIGYDEQYVYYSDPSKGIIDRKNRQDFKEAWQSMGSQAMAIDERE